MPGRIDQNRPFLPVNIAILTVSDTRDARRTARATRSPIS